MTNYPCQFLFLFLFLILVSLLCPNLSLAADTNDKRRLIVLTDIEADPDDTQSLVRLLVYSNQIDIEGIVATTSTHQKTRIAPESIRALIRNYRKVRSNLEVHEKGFPEANDLMALVKDGIAGYGMAAVGPGKNTEGSDLIISALEKDDPRPVWVSIWGGANTLAQALITIRETKTESEAAELIKKLRVYTISDQDDAGWWMRNEFPELFYIVTPGDYGGSTWIAINAVKDGANNDVISNKWFADNVQQGHGPLGSSYPDVTYGFEGDTPAFLSLIPNGLNFPERPDWGAWGGRYELYKPDAIKRKIGFTGGVEYKPETRKIWTDVSDEWFPLVANEHGRAHQPAKESLKGNQFSMIRWREDFQNDFAARMDWCHTPFEEANHPPVPAIAHSDQLTVKSGGWIRLDASGSSDPDGDSLSYYWMPYPEAGTCKMKVENDKNLYSIGLKAPKVEKPETLHFILRVTDKGSPALSRYKRVIVTVEP